MGQKVNPISLRLEKTNRHFDSCWYDDYNYTNLVLQDLRIKTYFKTVLNQIQYPEARVLIENLPKKTTLHLFYYNPTRSRQKKNWRFQLQDFNVKNYAQSLSTKKTNHALAINREDYQLHTTFQQVAQTKRKEEWKKSLTRFDLNLFEPRLSNPANSKKTVYQLKEGRTTNKNLPQPASFFTKTNSLRERSTSFPLTPLPNAPLRDHPCCASLLASSPLFFDKGPQLSLLKEATVCQPGLSVNLATPPVFYKGVNYYNLFLNFLLYTGKGESDSGKKWAKERFFVRYLVCFFYSKSVQNKRYTLNNILYGITTLYNPGLPKKRASFQRGVLSGIYAGNQVYKSHLESFLSKKYATLFTLFFFRSLIAKQSALFLVEEIIYYLERKIPFRRIKTSLLREIPQYKRIKGVRITCSGRVGGRSKKAQRSKTQSVKIGVTSLGVFSSKIDFACKSAKTRFGLIGVKVWVCYQ